MGESGRRNPGSRVWALAALALVAGWTTLVAETGPTPWSAWKTLRLEARSAALLRGNVEMRLADEASGAQRLTTRATARFMGATVANSRTETLYDPASRATRSYLTVTRKRARRFVFGDAGYTVEKFGPGATLEQPLDGRELVSRREFPYPRASDGRPIPLVDYYGMLLRLRQEPLNRPGDEITLHVAAAGGPQLYRIRVSEDRTSRKAIKHLKTGRPQTSEVRELRLQVVPADPADDEGFLGMEGETEVWVEAGSKTPLEISGKVPKIGRVTLRVADIG